MSPVRNHAKWSAVVHQQPRPDQINVVVHWQLNLPNIQLTEFCIPTFPNAGCNRRRELGYTLRKINNVNAKIFGYRAVGAAALKHFLLRQQI